MSNLVSRSKLYFRWLPVRDAVYFIVRDAFGLRCARRCRVGDVSVYLRPCSTDILVAASCLGRREFDGVKASDVSVIVDAGAYVGYSAIYFSRRFPDAKVVAVEMEPENYSLLVRNVSGYDNVMPVWGAVAARCGRKKIRFRSTGEWGYTIVDGEGGGRETGDEVRCETLDCLMRRMEIAEIDILKMDVEGAEREILRAGGEWLRRTRVLIVELHDRIVAGCEDAFCDATRSWPRVERVGEKVVAYRDKD